jgi:hypothetical protein
MRNNFAIMIMVVTLIMVNTAQADIFTDYDSCLDDIRNDLKKTGTFYKFTLEVTKHVKFHEHKEMIHYSITGVTTNGNEVSKNSKVVCWTDRDAFEEEQNRIEEEKLKRDREDEQEEARIYYENSEKIRKEQEKIKYEKQKAQKKLEQKRVIEDARLKAEQVREEAEQVREEAEQVRELARLRLERDKEVARLKAEQDKAKKNAELKIKYSSLIKDCMLNDKARVQKLLLATIPLSNRSLYTTRNLIVEKQKINNVNFFEEYLTVSYSFILNTRRSPVLSSRLTSTEDIELKHRRSGESIALAKCLMDE